MGDVDAERFAEAGLYDPSSPDAADRLALLEYLASHGVTLEEMLVAEGDGDGDLAAAAFDHRLGSGVLSASQLATRLGAPVEQVVETYRLLGIQVADVDELRFAEGEELVLELLAAAQQLFPSGMAEEILRSIGAGLSMMAEAAVSAFVGTVEDELELGSQLARAQTTTLAGELGVELGATLRPLLRHHLWTAVQRQRAGMRGSADRRESRLAVGFVDLVGFTAITERLGSAELVDFVTDFHRRAFDVVSRSGGRLVKHIGDEVMFTSAEPDGACGIALALLESFGELTTPPRGGLAHGVVVARHGDYYGPTVNLAARLADIAVPGEVLAAASLADAADGAQFTFEPAGRRLLKGFTEPVRAVSVTRAAG